MRRRESSSSVTISGVGNETLTYNLSRFRTFGGVERIVATTAPGGDVPDWKQHLDAVSLDRPNRKGFTTTLYPKSVYTFLVSDVAL
jgi:hypothetical protein